MSLRARFGLRPSDGKPQCRIVAPGADIDNATLAQIVFDADYAAARLAYQGSVDYKGVYQNGFVEVLAYPDMGYIPFTLIAAWGGKTGFRYYGASYKGMRGAEGPYGPYAQDQAIMACSFMDRFPQGASLNSVEATVTRTSLSARATFSFTGKLAYAIFAIPAG